MTTPPEPPPKSRHPLAVAAQFSLRWVDVVFRLVSERWAHREQLGAAFQRLMGSRYPYGVVLVGLAINLLSGALTGLIDGAAAPAVFWSFVLGMGMLGVGLVVVAPELVQLLLIGKTPPRPRMRDPSPARWLITMAGRGRANAPPAAVTAALHQHALGQLERVCLLHTTDDTFGLPAYLDVKAQIEDQLPDVEVLAVPVKPDEVNVPEALYGHLSRLITPEILSGALRREDIIFDYTSGPAAVTAAMTLLGAVRGGRLQYIVPLKVDENRSFGGKGLVQELELDFSVRPLQIDA